SRLRGGGKERDGECKDDRRAHVTHLPLRYRKMRRDPSKRRAVESITYSRKSWPWTLRSALAAGAVEARAAGHDACPDGARAARRGRAGPVVDRVVVRVGAEALEAVAVARDRRPAARDRPA